MLDWGVIAALLTLAIGILAPHQLGVTLYKLSLVSLAAVAGYWIDRGLFPYARPDELTLSDSQVSAAFIRRAIVVAAVILGVSWGA
jgi:hypothetical protein